MDSIRAGVGYGFWFGQAGRARRRARSFRFASQAQTGFCTDALSGRGRIVGRSLNSRTAHGPQTHGCGELSRVSCAARSPGRSREPSGAVPPAAAAGVTPLKAHGISGLRVRSGPAAVASRVLSPHHHHRLDVAARRRLQAQAEHPRRASSGGPATAAALFRDGAATIPCLPRCPATQRPRDAFATVPDGRRGHCASHQSGAGAPGPEEGGRCGSSNCGRSSTLVECTVCTCCDSKRSRRTRRY